MDQNKKQEGKLLGSTLYVVHSKHSYWKCHVLYPLGVQFNKKYMSRICTIKSRTREAVQIEFWMVTECACR